MSPLNANRRVISVVFRQSRRIHNSTTNQAAVLSPTALHEQQLEEISLQPIFDIFDAPSRLSESRDFIREKYKSTSTTPPDTITGPLPSSRTFAPPRPLSPPAPLPSPIVFDGPARPKNEALAIQRRLRDAGLSPQPRRHKIPASSRPFSSSEPLVQLFDGPARIARYHHQSQEHSNSSKLLISLGLVGAIGCVTFTKDDADS